MQFDLFNGDADGICALHQLRLSNPKPEAQLITGVKRDIKLLSHPSLADSKGSTITVLDVSLDSNREALLSLLAADNQVTYIDHHSADPLPNHPNLTAHIDTSPTVCTSLIVNELLRGSHYDWAICGAFGDNLHEAAAEVMKLMGIGDRDGLKLREIGELFNYNGYGSSIEDLHFHPKSLYRAIQPYSNALDFFHNGPELTQLREGYNSDYSNAVAIKEHDNPGKNRVFFFPDASWARRISGVFSNEQARSKPESAHALITHNPDNSYRISVRAPLNDRRDAHVLCKKFPTGGGRAAAAGINYLPESDLGTFIDAFNTIYS